MVNCFESLKIFEIVYENGKSKVPFLGIEIKWQGSTLRPIFFEGKS